MRTVALVAFGFVLLALQSAAATLVSIHPFAPNLLLPMVIYLGVAPDVHIVRGAAIAFVMGYFLDAFCGSGMGLQTFVTVSTFMVVRGAGLRLFLRGPVFQVILTFLACVLSGGTILALRAIFERPPPFAAGSLWDTVVSLVAPSLVTAAAAPLLFIAVRRIDGLVARRREEKAEVAAA